MDSRTSSLLSALLMLLRGRRVERPGHARRPRCGVGPAVGRPRAGGAVGLLARDRDGVVGGAGADVVVGVVRTAPSRAPSAARSPPPWLAAIGPMCIGDVPS